MRKREPVINLEPRRPFSWRVVGGLLAAWAVVLALVFALRWPMLRILLPLIGVGLVVYVAVCTVLFLKNRK